MSGREDALSQASPECVGGKYQLVRLLGEGGMGSVYEARHVITGKRVAVKRMSAAFAQDPVAVKRFLLEARVATSIEHPNVVEIYDFGAADGAPYMVMAFLEGMALSQHIEREGKLTVRATFELLAPILEALDAAHRIGIVHRDIKPDNIFLARTRSGEIVPKLLDFGISKSGESEDFKLTRTGTVMGTPYYMSPEQARGESKTDARADLYAMGVILYECLAGTVPFHADNYNALLLKIVTETPAPLARIRPDLTPAIVEAVERAMAKNREDRFASTLALRNSLARGLGEEERATVAPMQLADTAHGARVPDALAQSGIGPVRARETEPEVAILPPREREAASSAKRTALLAIALTIPLALGLAYFLRTAPETATPDPVIDSVHEARAVPPEQPRTPETPPGTGASRITRARLCAAQGLDRCVTDLLLGQAQSEEELALLIDTLVRLDEATVAKEQARRYRELYPRGPRYAELARLADDAAPDRASRGITSMGEPEPAVPVQEGEPQRTDVERPANAERRSGGLTESEF